MTKDCIFCKVIAGDLPSYKIYEDDLFIGILDIFPISKGHALLIPKTHYRWTYDVPEFGQYFETARTVGNAVMGAMRAEWVQFFTHGQVPHAHIHITPRYGNVETEPVIPRWDQPEKPTKEEFEQMAELIRAQLKK